MTKFRVVRIQMFSEVVYTHKRIILILLLVLLLAYLSGTKDFIISLNV